MDNVYCHTGFRRSSNVPGTRSFPIVTFDFPPSSCIAGFPVKVGSFRKLPLIALAPIDRYCKVYFPKRLYIALPSNLRVGWLTDRLFPTCNESVMLRCVLAKLLLAFSQITL